MAELFETFMVCAFGISWPISAYKSYKSRTSSGKSLLFSVVILIGYFFGIAGKIISGQITYVFVFYILNVIFVLLDLGLSIRNRALEKSQKQEELLSYEPILEEENRLIPELKPSYK